MIFARSSKIFPWNFCPGDNCTRTLKNNQTQNIRFGKKKKRCGAPNSKEFNFWYQNTIMFLVRATVGTLLYVSLR